MVHNKILLFSNINELWNYGIYVVIPFIITSLLLLCKTKLGSDNLGNIQGIEPANNDFLGNYLAFFFIALSLDKDWVTFLVCFGLTVLFTFYSRVGYFNPILLIFRYNFYYVTLESKSKILIITKDIIKDISAINKKENIYYKIDEFTYIDSK